MFRLIKFTVCFLYSKRLLFCVVLFLFYTCCFESIRFFLSFCSFLLSSCFFSINFLYLFVNIKLLFVFFFFFHFGYFSFQFAQIFGPLCFFSIKKLSKNDVFFLFTLILIKNENVYFNYFNLVKRLVGFFQL